jgi:hypothetical protein
VQQLIKSISRVQLQSTIPDYIFLDNLSIFDPENLVMMAKVIGLLQTLNEALGVKFVISDYVLDSTLFFERWIDLIVVIHKIEGVANLYNMTTKLRNGQHDEKNPKLLFSQIDQQIELEKINF